MAQKKKKKTSKKKVATKKKVKKAAKKKVGKKKAAKKTAKKKSAKKSAPKAAKKSSARPSKKTTPVKKKSRSSKKAKKSEPATAALAVETTSNSMDHETESASMPAVGTPAPEFKLVATNGEPIDLTTFRNRSNVVLYFYPKDDTPGCTVEACAFRDDFNTYAGTNTVVIGISPDDVASHEKFTAKYSLPFPLAADIGANVARQYGVWVEKNMYGNRKMGIQRATFLIDKTGSIAAVWPKVKVEGHSQEILDKLKTLS